MIERIYKWQDEKNIAPLTETQLDLIYDISTYINNELYQNNYDTNGASSENTGGGNLINTDVDPIENNQEFFKWYGSIEEQLEKDRNILSVKHFEQLCTQKDNLHSLLDKASQALDDTNKISLAYGDICQKTTLLNEMSEHLYLEQSELQNISSLINSKLHYFTSISQLSQQVSLNSLSMTCSSFSETLEKIDNCIEYMMKNDNYKESYSHLIKYKKILYNVLFLIKNYIKQILKSATEALTPVEDSQMVIDPITNSKMAFSLYYGKFQTHATKLRPIIEQLENRALYYTEYVQLLSECQHFYLTQRMNLMNNAILNAIKQLVDTYKSDKSTLFRTGCVFMLHVCEDETQLYHHFFKNHSPQLNLYLEALCTHLYDNLRPLIVHINHLETLAELCGILRGEIILDTEISSDAFNKLLWQLLQDVQERFVFRTYVYLQTDLLHYKPSAGDLAYPEKLQMMESIASQIEDNKSYVDSSPADLHGMWYPTVKRTLVCLSRLYRCVDRPIFQGLSQEALTICVFTIIHASNMISSKKTVIDGELFLIKHLLILREQIAPFQADFTIKEMSLDFTKVKNAALHLLQKRRQLFAFNAHNAIVEFLMEGTPEVKEQLLDSRKEIDKELKNSCEKLIKYCTNLLIGPILVFTEKGNQNDSRKGKKSFDPNIIGSSIRTVQHNIKMHLGSIQKSMQLYLANKETEFILFKLIRNNVMNSFTQLEQMLTAHYTPEQLLVIGCPTSEQIMVMMSSASLVSNMPSPEISANQ